MRVGGMPLPVHAPPAVALDDVTNGYVPWSTSSSVAWPASSTTVLPSSSMRVEQQRGVGDHRAQPLGVAGQFGDDGVDVERLAVVDLDQHLVLQVQRAVDLGAQHVGVEQVLHPDADARHLVGVGRADAASGRADLRVAEEALGDLVERAVVRRDDVRDPLTTRRGRVDAARLEPVDLLEQHAEVDDHAVADDRRAARREDAGRQQVQRVLLAVR